MLQTSFYYNSPALSDPPPERYWELLAEERRLALQEALEENERVSYNCYVMQYF